VRTTRCAPRVLAAMGPEAAAVSGWVGVNPPRGWGRHGAAASGHRTREPGRGVGDPAKRETPRGPAADRACPVASEASRSVRPTLRAKEDPARSAKKKAGSQGCSGPEVSVARQAGQYSNGYLVSPSHLLGGGTHAVDAVRRVRREPRAVLISCRVALVVGERASAVCVSVCPRRHAASVC
jgi:hypothetical protein